MFSTMIKDLEKPQYLVNSCNEFDKIVHEYSDKEKSDAALKTLIELYRWVLFYEKYAIFTTA